MNSSETCAPPLAGRAVRILHTSDWHLGKTLAEVDRTNDFKAFLGWLLNILEERRPDVLLIAGDVFDTTMPSSDAQRLYYEFLTAAARTPVKQVVVTAGNHDSLRFLRAPEVLLSTIRTTVSGNTAEEEAVVIRDDGGHPILGIAAVPYLRDGDVRGASINDTDADRAQAWERGVAEHYRDVREELLRRTGPGVPLIAAGHLFVAGSSVASDGDAREHSGAVNVGGLKNVPARALGEDWDYVALGHIHHPQTVKAAVPAVYSGSPLALDFESARDKHRIVQVDISVEGVSLEDILVPQPRVLAKFKGTLEKLVDAIKALGSTDPGAFCEATYEGPITDPLKLVETLSSTASDAGVNLAAVRSNIVGAAGTFELPKKSLDDITPEEVFDSVLDKNAVEDVERKSLMPLFYEVLEDARAQTRLMAERNAEAGKDWREEENSQ